MSENLKDKTAKGLLWGGLSNGIQQLLNLFFGIFLLRLLTDTDYGMVGMLTIFTVIANSLQESGFTSALVNKKDASHKDFNAVFWFSTLMGLAMYLLLFACAPLIAQYFQTPQLTNLSRILFVGFLLSSSSTAHNAVLFRNLMVKQRALTYLTAQTVSGTVGILLAWNGFAYWGLAIQSVTHLAVQTAMLWYFSPWRPTFKLDFHPLKEMFGFSSRILLTNIFTHINNNIFTVILGRYYQPAEVGNYTQANKWSYMGHSLITGMVNNVAQPVLAKVNEDPKRQLKVFRKMLRFTCFISFPALLGLSLVAPEFIEIVGTAKWLKCVPYMQMLCLWGAFMPPTTLFTNLIISKGKSDIFLYNTVVLGLLQIALIFAFKSQGIMTMLTGVVCLNIGWLFVWQQFVHRLIGLSLFDTLKDCVPFFFIAIICMFIAYFLTLNMPSIYLIFVSKIVIAATLYILCMYLAKATVFRESIDYILKRNQLSTDQ